MATQQEKREAESRERRRHALAQVPVMVIRGSNSDILSPATVDAMRAHRARLDVVEVTDEGHAPLLTGDVVIGRIAAFVRACEQGGH